jgi:hypothetical protein
MYTFEQLKEDVRKEAEALKIHATKEERERLDLSIMEPTNSKLCYYGLMTGNCYSERAAQLIEKCCCSFFDNGAMADLEEENNSIEAIQESLIGSKVIGFVKARISPGSHTYYSAIEAYILLPEARNDNLISYLRGETETLEL